MKEVGHPGPGDCDEPGRPTKGQIVGVSTPSRSWPAPTPTPMGRLPQHRGRYRHSCVSDGKTSSDGCVDPVDYDGNEGLPSSAGCAPEAPVFPELSCPAGTYSSLSSG